MESTQNVGDVNSTARGSGARFNAGKPPLDLLPLSILCDYFDWYEDKDEEAVAVLKCLATWQRFGDTDTLIRALIIMEEPIETAAHVFQYGAKKYAAWNWAKGMAWSIPLGCAARHLNCMIHGEVNDPESGLPHAGHVSCNIMMLLTFIKTFPEGDDRPRYLA